MGGKFRQVGTELVLSFDGNDLYKFAPTGDITLLGANAKIVGPGAGFETGDFLPKQRKSTPVGWIPATGGTIGSAASGATRANADTLALFTFWWTEYNDAELPILTSVGGASTRGATAAADWAANKRMSVFDVRDRVVRAPGTIQGNGTKLGATEVFDNYGNGSVMILPGTATATNNSDGATTLSARGWNQVAPSANNTTGLTAQKVRVDSHGCPGFYKL